MVLGIEQPPLATGREKEMSLLKMKNKNVKRRKGSGGRNNGGNQKSHAD